MNPLDYIPKGFTGLDGLMVMAGAAAFITVIAVWNALMVRDPMGGRIKSLFNHQQKLRDGLLTPAGNRYRQVDTVGLMRRLIDRFNLMRGGQAAKIADRLAGAGWRSKDALVIYLFLKVFLPFGAGGVASLFVYGFGVFDGPPMIKLLIAMAAVVCGAYAPEVFVKNATQKRRHELQKGLPDALDLLVICAEAGLALDSAMHRVAREMAKSSPEIADEFGLTAVELGFLPERRMALDNLARRADLPSVRGVVNTLLQTEKYGTPLAQSLRVLSAEFRSERMLKAEEKAAKLPATLTVPLVVFILPTLFVVLLGPAILKAIDGLGGL